MEIPDWLRTMPADEPSPRDVLLISRKRKEHFLDGTLRHVISFIEDTMFNEDVSMKNGFLQMIEPRLKVISLLLFIVVLSLQKSVDGIFLFSFAVVLLLTLSKVPVRFFVKKLLPTAAITLLISIPVLLNQVVGGDSLFTVMRITKTVYIGPLAIPKEITVTMQGLKSAISLLLRVLTSVSLVFLMIMTTPPNTFIKALSTIIPGQLKFVVSISYRYLFFLVRKVEQYIMGLKSRQMSAIKPAKGRHWVASRIGLLFSTSMKLSDELALAMESRGYKGEAISRQPSAFSLSEFSWKDGIWFVFTIIFCGVMIWKSSF